MLRDKNYRNALQTVDSKKIRSMDHIVLPMKWDASCPPSVEKKGTVDSMENNACYLRKDAPSLHNVWFEENVDSMAKSVLRPKKGVAYPAFVKMMVGVLTYPVPKTMKLLMAPVGAANPDAVNLLSVNRMENVDSKTEPASQPHKAVQTL